MRGRSVRRQMRVVTWQVLEPTLTGAIGSIHRRARSRSRGMSRSGSQTGGFVDARLHLALGSDTRVSSVSTSCRRWGSRAASSQPGNGPRVAPPYGRRGQHRRGISGEGLPAPPRYFCDGRLRGAGSAESVQYPRRECRANAERPIATIRPGLRTSGRSAGPVSRSHAVGHLLRTPIRRARRTCGGSVSTWCRPRSPCRRSRRDGQWEATAGRSEVRRNPPSRIDPAAILPDLEAHMDRFAEPGPSGYVFVGKLGVGCVGAPSAHVEGRGPSSRAPAKISLSRSSTHR